MKKTNIARLAVTAGLTLAMGTGMMAPATVAFAADGQGQITISQTTGNQTTFDGYQIFKATVTDSNGSDTKSTSDIQWADDNVKTVVEGAIKTEDGTYAGTTAQDAADFIKHHISGTDATTAVASNSFAKALADALEGSTLSKTTVSPDTATSLTAGYWLFVTTPSTVENGETATSPIFAVVGGGPVSVVEKDKVPTVSKTVKDGDNQVTAGSTGVGKILDYHLVGTVANDVATYQKYQYKFTDTLSNGLDYNEKSAVVKIGDTDVTNKASISYKDHVLTIDLGDLKAKGLNITKDTKVTVDYKATVNENAVAGITGNNLSNSVKLTYSNDPHFNDDKHTGETVNPPSVKEYTYKLNLIKKDRDTEITLPGAKFTLKSGNQYVQANGSLGDGTYEFTTGADGSIAVNGLDAGTYTVHETMAPNGYDTTSDFTVKIDPKIAGDDGQTLTAISNTVSGNGDAIAGESDGKTGDNQLTGGANASDVQTGTVTVTVGDKKEITMPLTGMKGTTALMVYGSAILVISAAAYLKHKRNAADNDAE